MAYNPHKDLKLYYSIGEVADMFDVNDSCLRYWEKEFAGFLHPKKTDGGTRYYRKEDVENVRLIHHLVKVQGLTIAGARKRLKENKARVIRNVDIVEKLRAIREELAQMKNELEEIV